MTLNSINLGVNNAEMNQRDLDNLKEYKAAYKRRMVAYA